MKSIRILLGALCAASAMSLTAYADDPQLVTVNNGHGQSVQLYRNNMTSIALYTAGSGVGAASCQSSKCQESSLQTIDKGQGKSVSLYR